MHNQNSHLTLETNKAHRRKVPMHLELIIFVELRIGFPPKQQVKENSASDDAYH